MTIPILLSESIPLEIRNILKSLERGQKVRLKSGEEGIIDFVCDQYITVSTNRWEDPNSMHGYRETKVLVYPHEWDDMYICLLYTSPSPRDATLSRMPSSA